MMHKSERIFFLLSATATLIVAALTVGSFSWGWLPADGVSETATAFISLAVLFLLALISVRKGMVAGTTGFMLATLGGMAVRMFSVLVLLLVGINVLKFNMELFIIVILLFYFYFLTLELIYLIIIGPKLKR